MFMKIFVWTRVLIIAIFTTISVILAIKAPLYENPDEAFHVDGFRYFENNSWPPPLGNPDLLYSPDGNSRVYYGEIVYWIFGKIGSFPSKFFITEEAKNPLLNSYLIYRFMNIVLYLLTLIFIFFRDPVQTYTIPIGILILTIPQITYLYSYANSDAWGLSMGILFTILVLEMIIKSKYSWKNSIISGISLGFLLGSKTPFLISLILPSLCFLQIMVHEQAFTFQKEYPFINFRIVKLANTKRYTENIFYKLLLSLIIAIVIFAPLRIIYPISQSPYESNLITQRENFSIDGYKPSDPYIPTFNMGAKGVTAKELLFEYPWFDLTSKSFYGLYGAMRINNPDWIYSTAMLLFSFLFFIAILSNFIAWQKFSKQLKLMIISGFFVVFLNILASIHNSISYDFQPQGRYLFPSLPALAYVLFTNIPYNPKGLKYFQITLIILLIFLAIYSLIFIAVPGLRSMAIFSSII